MINMNLIVSSIPALFVCLWISVPCIARAATCEAGYYLNDGECAKCNGEKEGLFYCPRDDTRHPCPAPSGAIKYETYADARDVSFCWAWFAGGGISNGSMVRYWCYFDPDSGTYGQSGNSRCGVYRNALKCDGGYYSNGSLDRYEAVLTPAELANRACEPVGAGYYSPDDATERTACPDGLTTIGFGRGADSADDCGKVMRVGNYVLYLHSGKITSPSLAVQYGNRILYGDMSPTLRGHLRAEYNGLTYSIFNADVD